MNYKVELVKLMKDGKQRMTFDFDNWPDASQFIYDALSSTRDVLEAVINGDD